LTGWLVDLTAALARNLASRKKSSGHRSHLIKTPDRISERPPRGGLSVLANAFRQCLLLALGDMANTAANVRFRGVKRTSDTSALIVCGGFLKLD